MRDAMDLHDADIFWGELHAHVAHVYVRLTLPADAGGGWSLSGVVSGPTCLFGATLPAKHPLKDLGPGPTLLARAVIPDPCSWTMDFPARYRARIELHRDGRMESVIEREFGLRSLSVRGRHLFWEGKRCVLRGVAWSATAERDLTVWRESLTTILAHDPTDELCEQASRQGVLIAVRLAAGDDLVSRLKRLAKYPAVGLAVLENGSLAERPAFPNLLLGESFAANQTVQPSPWADVAVVEATDDTAAFSVATANCSLPLVAMRPETVAETFADARVACDHLQRDLAGVRECAGYWIGRA